MRFCAFILMLAVLGCATPAPPLAPVDLSAPGWIVRQGQAVWQPDSEKPEIAGDIVLSTHPSGASYVQFSKTMPIVSARRHGGSWEVEFPAEDKRYSGQGQPPRRIVWLQLLRVLDGEQVPDRWKVSYPSKMFVALEDEHRGERLQIHFSN